MWNISDVQPFFFEAMRHGYAVVRPKSTIEELPGSKIITFERGDFKLVDCWHTTPLSVAGFGTTIIYAGGSAVWMMQYSGHYKKPAVAFLKKALAFEYMQDHPLSADHQFFNGCRGPRIFAEGNLTYINMPDPNSDFYSFSGREEIIDNENNNVSLGWHKYNGRILIL